VNWIRPDKAILCTALNFMSVCFIVSFQLRVYRAVWYGWLCKLDPVRGIQPAFCGFAFLIYVEIHLLLTQIHSSYFIFEGFIPPFFFFAVTGGLNSAELADSVLALKENLVRN